MTIGERVLPGVVNPLDLITPVNRLEGKYIEAYVPLGLINIEDVPVDERHVHNLADQIKGQGERDGGSGLLQSIGLGAIAGEPTFRILDGFHRVAAFGKLSRIEIYSSIRPDCTIQEVIDFRIVAARMHQSVRFPRIMEWVNSAWELTQWAPKIRVSQAVGLVATRHVTGSRMGLNPQSIEQVKDWVQEKCESWKIKPTTLYQHLLVAQIAAPELVKQTRGEVGNNKQALSIQQLTAITRAFPYRHDFQIFLARVATEKKLTKEETEQLAIAATQVENLDQVRQLVESNGWRERRRVSPEIAHYNNAREAARALVPSLLAMQKGISYGMRLRGEVDYSGVNFANMFLLQPGPIAQIIHDIIAPQDDISKEVVAKGEHLLLSVDLRQVSEFSSPDTVNERDETVRAFVTGLGFKLNSQQPLVCETNEEEWISIPHPQKPLEIKCFGTIDAINGNLKFNGFVLVYTEKRKVL